MAKKQQIVFEKITKRIINGEFVNGSFLPCELDLAKEYGFSRVTIRASLQRMVGQKILKTIPYKGYQVINIPSQPLPNALNIGALWCSNHFCGYAYNLYRVAEQEAKENQYELFVRSTDDNSKEQAVLLSELLELNPDGLLIVPTFDPSKKYMSLGNHTLLTLLRKAGKPLVMLDRDFPETDLPCVLNDEYGGGQMVAEHFASLGHERVALFAPDVSNYIVKQRFGGFLDGCRAKNIKTAYFPLSENEYLKSCHHKNSHINKRNFCDNETELQTFLDMGSLYELVS